MININICKNDELTNKYDINNLYMEFVVLYLIRLFDG